jgi:hypothetical protein
MRFHRSWLVVVLAVALVGLVGSAHAYRLGGPQFAADTKGVMTSTSIYIDEPESLSPGTNTQFKFRVVMGSDEPNEWLLNFYVTLPTAYTSITAVDPEPIDQDGVWEHTVAGSQVRFSFWNYGNQQGYPLMGDVFVGHEIVFTIAARVDSQATNEFPCQAVGDMNGSMSRVRYVGAPEIVRMDPANRRLADRTAPFEIEFAHAIDPESFDWDVSPDPGGLDLSWNGEGTIASIAHDELDRNDSLKITISAAADEDGLTANPKEAIVYTKSANYVSNYTPNPPTCDGLIIPGEWDAAEEAYEIGIGENEATLRVMNDVGRLYLALDVPADTEIEDNDQMFMYFDEDGDGKYPTEDLEPSEEGIYWLIFFDGDIIVNYRGLYGDWFSADGLHRDDDIENKLGVEAGVGFNVAEGGHLQYEFCPSFTKSYFNATPGGTFGFLLQVSDFEEYPPPNPFHDGEFFPLGQTPGAAFSGNPETFRTVELASAPPPEVDAIEPNQGRTNLTTDVTITGLYFAAGATAFIGDYPLVTPTFVNSGTITGLVRSAIPVGCYDVVVVNPDQQEGRLTNGFAICDAAGNCPECETVDDDTSDDDTSADDSDEDEDSDDACGC